MFYREGEKGEWSQLADLRATPDTNLLKDGQTPNKAKW